MHNHFKVYCGPTIVHQLAELLRNYRVEVTCEGKGENMSVAVILETKFASSVVELKKVIEDMVYLEAASEEVYVVNREGAPVRVRLVEEKLSDGSTARHIELG